ncbi:MAG: hypothetical protein ACI4AI_05410, partial [Paludibacteraceae bacterium]
MAIEKPSEAAEIRYLLNSPVRKSFSVTLDATSCGRAYHRIPESEAMPSGIIPLGSLMYTSGCKTKGVRVLSGTNSSDSALCTCVRLPPLHVRDVEIFSGSYMTPMR